MLVQRTYTAAVHRHLHPLYANWEPSAPIALGDYGRLEGALFRRMGNLAEFNLSWEVVQGASNVRRSFVSSRSVSVRTTAGASSTAAAQARLEIGFSAAKGVFMDAAGCTYLAIDNKRRLGEALETTGNFDRSWAVVTDLIKAKRTIVAISNESGAEVVFEASGTVGTPDLADASIDFRAVTRNSIGYLIEAERNLNPLIGLCGFRKRFFAAPDFVPFAVTPAPIDPAPTSTAGPLEFVQLH